MLEGGTTREQHIHHMCVCCPWSSSKLNKPSELTSEAPHLEQATDTSGFQGALNLVLNV